MSSELSREQLERILDAVETIEECLERLVRARDEIDRGQYHEDEDMQAIVERRFLTSSPR